MPKWPGAIWQPCKNFSGTLRPIAVCLHHQAGNGNPINVYNSRGVSAHFWIPKVGQPYQHVDTANQAWHGIQHNAYSIGVETEGCATAPNAEPLTENQLAQFAALMQWANTTHGIPLVLSEAVTTPGLNYHRCKGGPATGCPCDVRINSRTEILNRVKGIVPIPPQPVEKGAMDLTRSASGNGYYILGSDGGVFTFGDATFFGSLGDVNTNAPIVDIAVRPQGDGYWLVGADGGVFTFGDAPFCGSMGDQPMNSPVTGIECTEDGSGYWLLGQDGGIFSFNAPFYGAATGQVY